MLGGSNLSCCPRDPPRISGSRKLIELIDEYFSVLKGCRYNKRNILNTLVGEEGKQIRPLKHCGSRLSIPGFDYKSG